MSNQWYPENSDELNRLLDKYLSQKADIETKKIHGLIVPHAGYFYSGEVAGKAFSLLKNKLKNKIEKAVVIGPSHYIGFYGIRKIENIETPLGKLKISKEQYEKIGYEHSIDNQIPFLQKLNPEIEILPLVAGEISKQDAEEFAKKFLEQINESMIFIFSTDLSHFLPYNEAVKIDKQTIKIIEELDLNKIDKIEACGIFPLMIMMYLCKLKNWKPELIEYKNSGDITEDKSGVVGYASFCF